MAFLGDQVPARRGKHGTDDHTADRCAQESAHREEHPLAHRAVAQVDDFANRFRVD